MAYQASSYPVKPMNATDRILGEAQKVRPPTQKELTDPGRAYLYARDVIYGRFPEGEAALATDPEWAYDYAVDVIKGRWPEAEAAIATSPDLAYNYARYFIKGRFPEAEAAIATDSWDAYYYAADILKGRFPDGEPAMAKDPDIAERYLKKFPDAKREWVMRGWLDWFDL